MYRSSPLRSTLNTNVITGLDMCKVCTEAVHCVYSTLNRNVITGLDMCKVCTPIDRMIFAKKGCRPEWFRGVFLIDAFVVFLFESENRDFGVPI